MSPAKRRKYGHRMKDVKTVRNGQELIVDSEIRRWRKYHKMNTDLPHVVELREKAAKRRAKRIAEKEVEGTLRQNLFFFEEKK